MKRLPALPRRMAVIALGLFLEAAAATPVAAADDLFSINDIRFAAELGASLPSSAKRTDIPPSFAPADFRGSSGQSCASLDLNTFLHQFNPHELIAELRQSLLAGAQSEISNYLVALAYSAPTLASVLDMTDRQLHARFTAFARNCATQQLRAVGLVDAERRLAQASDQCFARESTRGTAPTEAYRRCSVLRSFDTLALPATLTTLDFLRQHSDLAVTARIQSLLALLPDERIVAGSYQVEPPRTSLQVLAEVLRTRSRLALDQVISGAPPAGIAECEPDSNQQSSAVPCLPRTAFDVVNSPAFRGARVLGPAALSLFKDALSSQIAATAVYSDLVDLSQQVAGMNLRSSSDASADEIQTRRRALQEQVTRLLGQADLQMKLQQSKLQLARTQLLALERSRADLETQAEALLAQNNSPAFSVIGMLRLFQGGN